MMGGMKHTNKWHTFVIEFTPEEITCLAVAGELAIQVDAGRLHLNTAMEKLYACKISDDMWEPE